MLLKELSNLKAVLASLYSQRKDVLIFHDLQSRLQANFSPDIGRGRDKSATERGKEISTVLLKEKKSLMATERTQLFPDLQELLISNLFLCSK